MNTDKKVVRFLLIRGCPGSGKSTVASKLAAKYGVKHFENDAYLMHRDKYVWTPEAAKDAAKQCFEDAMSALRSGKDTIVSNVFVTRKSIDRYVHAAKQLGCEVQVWRMTNDFGNVHDVPTNVLASMKAGFQDYPGEKLVDATKLKI